MERNPLKILVRELKIAILVSMVSISSISATESYSQFGNLNAGLELQMMISGKVTDALSGELMPGVNVVVKGTNIGAITDMGGKYSINVSDINAVLVFSFIGYSTREVPIAGQSVIDITLESVLTDLDEVVVIGYGTMKKSDLTGSVVRADIESFRESPNVSVMQSLQGSVAGLNVGQINESGSEPDMLIRGLSTLAGETSPLIVVDNVIYRGNIIDLNPNDIESIDILKDASSAAIYGSQATNGVILITTTRSGGEDGKPKFTYSGSYSFQSPTKYLRPPGLEGFYKQTAESDILQSRTEESGYLEQNPDWDIASTFDSSHEIDAYNEGRSTDWYNLVTNDNMYTNSHNLSLSNSTKFNNYLISFGYTEVAGYMVNENYERINSRINIDNRVTDWMMIGVQSFLTLSDYSGQSTEPENRYIHAYSTAHDAEGNIEQIVAGNYINPLLEFDSDNLDKRLNLYANIYANIDFPFIRGLSYKINFANNYRTTDEYYFREYESTFQGQGSKSEGQNYDWTTDNILSFKRNFNDIHNLELTLVYGLEKRSFSSTRAIASVFNSFTLGYNKLQVGSSELQQAESSAWEEASMYNMARVFYGFNNKYLFTGTIRRDGFSGFGENNKFGIFPSMSIAWVVSEEPFLDKNPWLNHLKLRLSYGSVGNRTIGRYQTLARIAGGYDFITLSGTSLFVQSTSSLASPNLQWETTTGINAGVDFRFAKIVYGSIDYYNNNTSNLLYEVDIPSIGRFEKFPDNLGKLHNQGLELSISLDLKRSDFEWLSTFIFSRNRNTLKELLGFDNDGDGKEDDLISAGLFIGESINAIYDYKVDGLWQVNDEIPAGADLGSYKIIDLSGDGTIDPKDKTIIGDINPSYMFSINNAFRYKEWTLRLFINSIQGGKNYYLGENNLKNFSTVNHTSHLRYVFPEGVDYWTPENPDAMYQRPGIYVSEGISGRMYSSRSFVRLQDVSLSYTTPTRVLERLKIYNLKVYLSGKNLLTLTKWNGWDPETGLTIDRRGRPVIKSFTVGLDFEF